MYLQLMISVLRVTKCKKNGRYGKCYVQSCRNGYSTSTWTNRCDKFGNYYLVIGIGAATFVTLSVLICLGFCMCYRLKLPKLAARKGMLL